MAGFGRGSAGGSGDERSVPVPASGWYEALAAPYRVSTKAVRTACGHRAEARMVGVAHPVLPCGAKLVIAYEDEEALVQVVDRGTGIPGREFEVTAALAARLGLRGVQPIRWRFAAQ